MKKIFIPAVLIAILLTLTGCISPRAVNQYSGAQGWYQVRPSDTLYSIAWRYGLDYKALARWNEIDVNSTIHPGQYLLLIEPSNVAQTAKAGSTAKTNTSTPASRALNESKPSVTSKQTDTISAPATISGKSPSSWRWPTKGKLVSTYSAKKLDRRGIDIAGELGQPVFAVADGRVVYSGNGLTGYGNLIIIKHSDTYLSAYAYNQQRLVKEGMAIKAGRIIAKMGQHKTRKARLHFQIRKNGKPVDPLKYLPKR